MVDAEEFFEDGLAVNATIAGVACNTRGFLDSPIEEAFGGTVNTPAFELRYATAALPGMRKNQVLTIGGIAYKTAENPKAVFDGATSVAALTKVAI